MADAFIAFHVFFDWFYCVAVKKEAFMFVVQRHVVIPAVTNGLVRPTRNGM